VGGNSSKFDHIIPSSTLVFGQNFKHFSLIFKKFHLVEVLCTYKINGYQSTMYNPHKDWLIQEQTALGKDISNPFIAENLPKIVWYSTHHILKSKELASPKGYGLW
jgi:hypothetical protein